MIKYLAVWGITLILSGCAISPCLIPTETALKVDEAALQSCKDLKAIPEDTSDFFYFLEAHATNVELYKDCKLKQETSIKLIKQLGNIR